MMVDIDCAPKCFCLATSRCRHYDQDKCQSKLLLQRLNINGDQTCLHG